MIFIWEIDIGSADRSRHLGESFCSFPTFCAEKRQKWFPKLSRSYLDQHVLAIFFLRGKKFHFEISALSVELLYKVTQKVLLVLVTFYSFSGEADKKVDLCYEIGLFPSEWQTYSPKSRKRWSEEAPSLQGYLRHDDLLLIFTRVKLSKSGLAWLKDPGISKRGMGRRLKFYEMCSGVRL